MIISILTLFPDSFTSILQSSILKRALENKLVTINFFNLRDFAVDQRGTVDEKPFGGGAGMVLRVEPVVAGIEHILKTQKDVSREKTHIVLLTPQGTTFTQAEAVRLTSYEHIILICGHYEGVDERVRELIIDEELSIGDYVLTGGEIPAMVILDSVARLLPGVLGNKTGTEEESFSLTNDKGQALLEYPQYTQPREFRGLTVPDVLLSGHHEEIAKWRQKKALEKTSQNRPDLIGSEETN